MTLDVVEDESARVCERTGLKLARSDGQTISRIAKTSWGPLNPPKREVEADRRHWGRFDVEGQQTVYGGSPAAAAYAESLAGFRVDPAMRDTFVEEMFDDEGDASSLLEAIGSEWQERHHMSPGRVPRGWRVDRLEYSLTLPVDGWFVDVSDSSSISALNRELVDLLHERRLPSLTLGALTSEDRDLTTAIAEWVWVQTLDDGSRPHGIRYPSKHGDDFTCWAVFLRQLGDGKTLASEPTSSNDGEQIADPDHNAPLSEAIRLFGLSCY